jgi:hypothetical protein
MKGQWKPKDQYKKSFENTKYELKIRFVDLDQRFLNSRGAGYLLPGVWWCPPIIKFPQEWGGTGG